MKLQQYEARHVSGLACRAGLCGDMGTDIPGGRTYVCTLPNNGHEVHEARSSRGELFARWLYAQPSSTRER